MKLFVSERIRLLNMLPTSNWDYSIYLLREELFKKLGIQENEKEIIKWKAEGEESIDDKGVKSIVPQGQVVFKNELTDIDLNQVEIEFFRKELEKIEKEKKLNAENISLFLKFIKGKE